MMYNELKSVHHCPRPVWVLCVQKLIRFEFVSKDMGGLWHELAPFTYHAQKVWHFASHLLSFKARDFARFASLVAWEQVRMQFPMVNPDK